MVSQKYRWDFIGLSTDEKPTSETSDKVVNGSTYYCSDISKLYVYCDGTWYERKPLGGGGGGGGTSDFNDLSNRPKYNGSDMTGSTNIPEVVTYSDFTGTDGTAAGEAGLVPAPATTDARKFLGASGLWETIQSGGGITELTTADYNYPADNPTYVALWLLEPGVYWRASANVEARWKTASAGKTDINSMDIFIISGDITTSHPMMAIGDSSVKTTVLSANGGGTVGFPKTYLTGDSVVDNLTSTSATTPLSANQGKVLKDLIDSIAIRGAGAPTTSTVGTVGQLYEDGTNGALYQLKSIDITVTPNTYNWEEVGAGGGSGPTVVQTTGTSTTDVMSQNAVTSMVFADPSTMYKIKIGAGASSSEGSNGVEIGNNSQATGASSVGIGNIAKANGSYDVAIGDNVQNASANGVAIGRNAYVENSSPNAIALGGFSRASGRGVFSVQLAGSGAGGGYNNSNYRLLTGLYDGQNDHDAATVGQLKMGTLSASPTGTTVGFPGRLYTLDTGGGTYEVYLCVHDNGDNTYVWKQVSLI